MLTPDWSQFESENRGLHVESSRFLGEGWTFCAFLVNDALVVRCPKRAEHWPELEREVTFLAFAADRLPLAVPRYLHVNPYSPAAPHGYAVYGYVHGFPLNVAALNETARVEAADRLAGFLRAMHGLQPDDALAQQLPRDDTRQAVERFIGRAELEIGPRLEAPEMQRLQRILEEHLSAPGTFVYRPAVVHADFSAEHILVSNHSVAAVIDFGDVSWGDPDYDFMYLLIDAGEAFVDDVARCYGHPDPERLRSKLRAFALMDSLDTILKGEGYALDDEEPEAWRRLHQLIRPGRL